MVHVRHVKPQQSLLMMVMMIAVVTMTTAVTPSFVHSSAGEQHEKVY
jgi:hypothetical protein